MTTTLSPDLESTPSMTTDSFLLQDIDRACARIAPSWPLDRFIAVNPYWGHLDQHVAVAAAELGTLSGTRLTMPRAYYRQQWQAGRLRREHLASALRANPTECTVQDLEAALVLDDAPVERLPLITDLADAARLATEPQPWSELCVHQISQHSAAWFDHNQAAWRLARSPGLYGSWRKALAADRGLPTREGYREFAQRVLALPEQPTDCIAFVVGQLGLNPAQRCTWLAALLGSVRGWAAWCAHERWQARLAGGDDVQIVHLLAMRAAWDWLLVADLSLQAELGAWRTHLDAHGDQVERLGAIQATDWLLQHALEIAFQAPLQDGLRQSAKQHDASVATIVQAVFCIDVRSERFRRALEVRSGNAVRTRGFAGFFGLPIEFTPFGTDAARPQLPGLLAPARSITQQVSGAQAASVADCMQARRQDALGWRQRWQRFRTAAASAFTFVESCGLLYGHKLLRSSMTSTALPERAEHAGLRPADAARLRPQWAHDHRAPTPTQRVELAAGVLRAMGLVGDFPRVVLLAGHGSTSANNPHAAGFDCGACGGQTGEVNARVLAALLQDEVVRAGLQSNGIEIPPGTLFVAGLHDTTTDELPLFDVYPLPPSHADDLRRLRAWLAQAGDATRAERAPLLGLGTLQHDAPALVTALRQRAANWAQVRPEWGLADNAAFVVAPRARTRHLDLGGRVFLHDYDHASDPGLAVLTLIMTAPMVVTNWINLQYYASTVDNLRFGSGNKVLHNVVGGNLGVFEGNGGDLRIGLAMQSLHDGERWRHTPLRLSVYIEAPVQAIDDVIAAHLTVRHLVENGWLHLFRIGDDGRTWQRGRDGVWHATDA